ncbi:Sec-independent protein translocase protein TATA, chloroplastic isoform B [Glycine soja]|uniref:Sec-independent protein translocase protein TATA, chloroplastic isoform A n=1 Tax=Glycine soja TaxID=3848 RepID=A0A445F8Y1_GLYSO|nr:Sec-independent protein translocase protein TATA, chloroplastic isoform A [Glycine soja]RZB45273.1 Sec-independent protein translocase protein TATA, chloroplastic isoform B [Glycine soja]
MDLTLSPSSSSSSSSSSLVISRPSYSSSSSTLSFLATNSILSRKARISTRRSKALTCNALFGLGVPELVVIAGVAVLAFGPKNLPQVGRSIGKTIKSFQQAAKEFESEIKKEPDSTEENPAAAEKSIAVSEQEEQETKLSIGNNHGIDALLQNASAR